MDQIMRDLVDAAHKAMRKKMEREVQAQVELEVESKILEALVGKGRLLRLADYECDEQDEEHESEGEGDGAPEDIQQMSHRRTIKAVLVCGGRRHWLCDGRRHWLC